MEQLVDSTSDVFENQFIRIYLAFANQKALLYAFTFGECYAEVLAQQYATTGGCAGRYRYALCMQ
jgi:hypothetical protein